MTRRPPIHPRAVLQLAAVSAVVIAIIATLGWLERQRPILEDDFVVQGAVPQRGGELTYVVCERRLPGQPVVEVSGETTTEPLGRVRSSEVVACPDQFDGTVVEFVGEVVGDVLSRDGGAWVLMNDDAYALESGPLPAHAQLAGTNTGLTVWLPEGAVDLSSLVPGRPSRRGDVLAVRGTLLRADPADGGGMTIRADVVEVVAPATGAEQPLHVAQAIAAVIAAAGAGGAVGWHRLARRRR